eukprot:2138484-Alexandrium_andersonii.AAC.1
MLASLAGLRLPCVPSAASPAPVRAPIPVLVGHVVPCLNVVDVRVLPIRRLRAAPAAQAVDLVLLLAPGIVAHPAR